MKRICAVFSLVMMSNLLFAQAEMSAFTSTGRAGAAITFVTDYQALGINPANLGWKPAYEGKIGAFGLVEGTYSAYSEALSKQTFRESIKDFSDDQKFNYQQKLDAAEAFTDANLVINIDLLALGFFIQPKPEIGGFSFGIKERIQWYSRFNQTVSEIMFLGYEAPYFDTIIREYQINGGDTTAFLGEKGFATNPQMYSQILDGSRISLSWFREFNLSYGRIIVDRENFSLYGGIGLKYLVGIAIMEVKAENGNLEAYSAITPRFDIDYGKAAEENPSTVEQGSALFPKPVGQGFGMDIGFSAIINESIKFGISLIDVGSITWDGNVYVADDDTLNSLESDGFDSYNIFQEGEEIVGDDGVFDWNGLSKKTTSLPTAVRIGGGYKIIDELEVGADIVIPANEAAGNYERLLFAFGVDGRPIPWLRLSTGFTAGGNYGFNLPVGIGFTLGEGSWEFGVASRDAITFFTENRPTLSVSAGFLRFRF